MEILDTSHYSPPPPTPTTTTSELASGKEGWRAIFWKQSLPPGYQPRPRSPPTPTSSLIPGELWGATREEIQQWRERMGVDTTTTTTTTTNVTADAVQSPAPLTWGSPSFVERPVTHPPNLHTWPTTSTPSPRPFHPYGQLNWKEDEDLELEKEHDDEETRTDSTLFRTSPVKSFPQNLFGGAPIVPTSVSESPKSALNALYGKEMTTTPITEASYFYWDNGGPPHALRFTCVLVCPATYEIFPAGRYISTATTASQQTIGQWVDEEQGLVWYSRKKEAAQGAAAFRYDCWYYRAWLQNNPHAPKCHLLGKDIPYASASEERPQKVLAAIPSEVMESIEVQITKWKEQALQRARDAEVEAMVELEDVAYRTAYIETRGTNNTTTTTTTTNTINPNEDDAFNELNAQEGAYELDDEDLEEVEEDGVEQEQHDDVVIDDCDDDDEEEEDQVNDDEEEDEIVLPS